MPKLILEHESFVRVAFFIGGLILFTGLESLFPRKKYTESKWYRWWNNLSITLFNSLLLRALPFGLAVGVALWCEQNNFGLLQQFKAPQWMDVVLSFLILDLVIYFQHRAFHSLPWLWRLHSMHHTDVQLDASSALRFHPIEILISMLIKMITVALLGAPVLAVIVFEVVLNLSAMFNHANWRLGRFDGWLRYLLVTPDMHRVHHSIYPNETHSNFAFALSFWDRVFRTYVAKPKDGHEKMVLGLNYARIKNDQRFDRLLFQPFKRHSPD